MAVYIRSGLGRFGAMITPKDLYLVIGTILVWATAIFSAYVLVTRPAEDASLTTFQTEVLQEASSAILARMAFIDYRIDHQLDDLASYRLRTLYAPQAQATAARTLFLENFDGIVTEVAKKPYDAALGAKTVSRLVKIKEAALLTTEKDLFANLNEFQEIYGYRKEDLRDVKKNISKNLAALDDPSVLVTPVPTLVQFLERAELIRLSYLLGSREYQAVIATSAVPRGCSFGPRYFPVVAHHPGGGRVGEALTASIGVTDFVGVLDPANVRLVVGADTIAFGENGLAEVPLSTMRRGRQTEEMTLVVSNPLTGEIRKSASQFSWTVH